MYYSLQNQLDYFGDFLSEENAAKYNDFNMDIERIKDEVCLSVNVS